MLDTNGANASRQLTYRRQMRCKEHIQETCSSFHVAEVREQPRRTYESIRWSARNDLHFVFGLPRWGSIELRAPIAGCITGIYCHYSIKSSSSHLELTIVKNMIIEFIVCIERNSNAILKAIRQSCRVSKIWEWTWLCSLIKIGKNFWNLLNFLKGSHLWVLRVKTALSFANRKWTRHSTHCRIRKVQLHGSTALTDAQLQFHYGFFVFFIKHGFDSGYDAQQYFISRSSRLVLCCCDSATIAVRS